MLRRILSLFFAVIWLAGIASSAAGAYQPISAGLAERVYHLTSRPGGPLSSELKNRLSTLSADQKITVILTLNSQVDLSGLASRPVTGRQRAVNETLRAVAESSQNNLRALLASYQAAGRVEKVAPLWIFNGISLRATPDVIRVLASQPEVYSITPDFTFSAPETPQPQTKNGVVLQSSALVNPNLSQVNAPAMWNLGFRGKGVVVAILDTGVDATHPELSAQYRGGSNSWYDPYTTENHPTPFDSAGHGTAALSVILGKTTGMAPDATWIAAKIFDDQGTANVTAVHQAFQWVLDPDGNPATSDAPQVISNSWNFASPICDMTFQPDLQALRAAGILPIFSAGNFGSSGPDSGSSPANYPEAFAVGAVDNTNAIAYFSSLGPNSCGQAAPATFPSLVAPGVDIPVAARGGGYTVMSGTSFSAPHVAGALALLLSAHPGLSLTEQQNTLLNGAVDLGAPGPDNTFGSGLLNVLISFNRLAPMVIQSRLYMPIVGN
jgi:subtilisin family serine protease